MSAETARPKHSLVTKVADKKRMAKERTAQFRRGVTFQKAAAQGAKELKATGAGGDLRVLQDPDVYVTSVGKDLSSENVGEAAFLFLTNVTGEDPRPKKEPDTAEEAEKKKEKKAGRAKAPETLAREKRIENYKKKLVDLTLASGMNKDVVKKICIDTYSLEPVPYVPTSSIMAPSLRWAKTTDDNIRVFIDATKRLVVKMYPLDTILSAFIPASASKADEEKRDIPSVVDLANDIAISYYLTSLVCDYDRVVTPHFAYPVDWFIGPKIDADGVVFERNKETQKIKVTDVRTLDNTLAQYVVVERADMTLEALLESPSLSVRQLRSLLFQIFFSLDAAWRLNGYLHYDAHASNFMVRNLLTELESPYLNRAWAYKRPGVSTYSYLTVADHGHLFVEIIDAGRSRMFVSRDTDTVDPATGRRPLHLIGYSVREEYGIFVEETRDKHVDRSWDVRRIGLDLLASVDVDRLAMRQQEGSVTAVASDPAEANLARDLASLIGTMIGGNKFVEAVSKMAEKQTTDAKEDKKAKKAKKAVPEVVKKTPEEQARANMWQALKAAAVEVNANGIPTPETIYRVFHAAIVKAVVASPADYENLYFDTMISEVFFNLMVDPATVADYRDDTLHAASCLDHELFKGLQGPADEKQRLTLQGNSLVVGYVARKDVLLDPATGKYPPRGRSGADVNTESVGPDDSIDDKDDEASKGVPAASKAAGRAKLERVSMLKKAASTSKLPRAGKKANLKSEYTVCAGCGEEALGLALPERVPYCGLDCIWSEMDA